MGKREEFEDLNANTEEEWDRLKSQGGLIVVDIYSKWAGPCTVMKAIIFKIKGKVSSMQYSIEPQAASTHGGLFFRKRERGEGGDKDFGGVWGYG